jgi:hypothetical protein
LKERRIDEPRELGNGISWYRKMSVKKLKTAMKNPGTGL